MCLWTPFLSYWLLIFRPILCLEIIIFLGGDPQNGPGKFKNPKTNVVTSSWCCAHFRIVRVWKCGYYCMFCDDRSRVYVSRKAFCETWFRNWCSLELSLFHDLQSPTLEFLRNIDWSIFHTFYYGMALNLIVWTVKGFTLYSRAVNWSNHIIQSKYAFCSPLSNVHMFHSMRNTAIELIWVRP